MLYKWRGRIAQLIRRHALRTMPFLIRNLKYVKLSAMLNLIKSEASFMTGAIKLNSFPSNLIFETGNICNLRCTLCPTGQGKPGLPKGMLSFQIFKHVLNELEKYLITVEFGNWGEPLLNPELPRMIRYAKYRNICVILDTNFNVPREIIYQLMLSKPNKIHISLEGASQQSVEKYQQGNNFKKVLSNLRYAQQLNSKLDLGVQIKWGFTVNKFNEFEIPTARKICRELGIKLSLGAIRCDTSSEVFMNPTQQYQNVKEWLPKNQKFSMYDYFRRRRKFIPRNGCSFLWNYSVINWDGSVFPCCIIYEHKFNFGNLIAKSFKEIWNNQMYKSSRLIIAHGIQTYPRTVCHICYDNEAMI